MSEIDIVKNSFDSLFQWFPSKMRASLTGLPDWRTTATKLKQLIQELEEVGATTAAGKGDLVTINAQFIKIGSEFPQKMPRKVRKDTGSFYTTPWAAELLSRLATPEMPGGDITILDPACGAGILLLTTLQQMAEQKRQESRINIIGFDLNPFSARVARLTLESYARSLYECISNISVDIVEGDALNATQIPQQPICDLVIMNPPFSSVMRFRGRQKQELKEWAGAAGVTEFLDARMGLHFYFLFLADLFLQEGGRLALVIPSTTFAGKAARILLQYLLRQKYRFEYLVETTSLKGAFSADCNWKEYLAILRKGGPENNNTRLVQFTQEPPLEAVKSIASQILRGKENLQVEGTQIGGTKRVPAEIAFAGQIGGEFLFFQGDWAPLTSRFNNPALVPLGMSKEIKVFRGFDATYSRFLILPNEFLDDPKPVPKNDAISFTIRDLPTAEGAITKIEIPLAFLKPCLRDARSHGAILEAVPKFWLLLIPPETNNRAVNILRDAYLTPIQAVIEKEMSRKAQTGGKETAKGRLNWFYHPSTYFGSQPKDGNPKPADLVGRVWTFNRYGLWRRQNVAVLCTEPVTGNHGCYSYYFTDPVLRENVEESWELLAAWFNSTWYLGTLFQHAKVPAKHVQQVNLAEHRQMLVPHLGLLLRNALRSQEIRQCLHDLHCWLQEHPGENLPTQMRASYSDPEHPRVHLDEAWAEFLGEDPRTFWTRFRPIYEQFETLF